MTKMDTTAIWIRTIGARALWPTLVGMMLLALSASAGVLEGTSLWMAFACWFIVMMTMPASVVFVFAPGETWVERRSREHEQARARAELARFGLTPQQYISTIPEREWVERARAAYRFGVESA